MARKKKQLPLLENITIQAVAAEGKSLARVDDLVVFAPYVVPCDVVDLQVRRKNHSYAEAEVVNIHHYSELRDTPFCEHYGVCGGCKWQCLKYEEQLKAKQQQITDNLYTFAMEKAPVETEFVFPGFEDVRAGIVKWPMSVIRLDSPDPARLVDLADRILDAWRGYTDEAAVIFAETDGEPHNTITPIARRRGADFELDLVLRNNLTTEEYPLGLYHPHPELHHIKKENIGLIEVMGLAVLPARLREELAAVAEALASGKDLRADERTEKHADWAEAFAPNYEITSENAVEIVRAETGKVFAKVLEHAGVYARTPEGKEAFLRFLENV